MPSLRLAPNSPGRFLRDQFHGLFLASTVQRANVYGAGAAEAPRDGFRVGLRQALDTWASTYRRLVGDAVHVRWIVALAERLTREHLRAMVRGASVSAPPRKP